MPVRLARAVVNEIKEKELEAEDLGRLFLKTEGIKRFVVSSPGDISVKCQLNDREPNSGPSE